MRRGRNGERGSVYGEAAFTIPLIMLVTLMLLQAGLLAWGVSAASNAARHGARMGAVAQSNPAAVAVGEARRVARREFPLDGSPTVSLLAPGGRPGSELTVRVTLDVPNIIGPLAAFFGGRLPAAWQVSGEASFRQEGW